jgi:ribosome-binding ATPase YchF (GTP1/OBG family)
LVGWLIDRLITHLAHTQGEATKGYDPINDIEWLDSEIHAYHCSRSEKTNQ